MAPVAAANAMTKITLSFMLSLLGDNNFQGPDAPVNSKYHWAYRGPEGPEFWHLNYKFCAGDRQSPINIESSFSEYDNTLQPITLNNFDVISGIAGPCLLNVTNNGHAASIRVTNENMWIQGGGLGQRYRTVEFHFHWGSTDDLGSEHAFNGRKYPLEMHVVNFAEKYGTVKQAMTQPDGLAVLGVFFELSEKDNPNFAAIDDALRHIQKAGDHTTVNQLILRSLLPEDLSKFWRYNGSLTTPFCFESVIWTVFAEPLKISKMQLETMRSLLHEEEHDIKDRGKHHRPYTPSRLLENWRPIQALNGRVIKRSFIDTGGGGNLLNKPMTDIKISPYHMPAPTLSNFDDASAVIVGGVNLNADPLAPLALPPSYSVQKPPALEVKSHDKSQTNSQLDKNHVQVSTQNKQSVHRSIEGGPVTVKYLISNTGSGFLVGNSTNDFSNSANFDKSSSNARTSTDEKSIISNFGQKPQSALGGGLEISKTVQVLKLGHPATNGGSQNGQSQGETSDSFNIKLITSIPNEFLNGKQLKQEINAEVSTTDLKIVSPAPSFSNRSPSRIYIDSRDKLSSPLPHIELSSSVDIQSYQRQGSQQNHKTQQGLHQQNQNGEQESHQTFSDHMNLNSRVGTMDSRIAELANQIRLHRQHGNAPHRSQNKSQPVMNFGNTFLQMPPVVRHHNQQQSSQNRFYAQSRLRSELMQQRRQILQLNKPPTPQQLRAILGKLAATSRINARPPLITSGAASIPQRKSKDSSNSIAGSHNYNRQQPAPIGIQTPEVKQINYRNTNLSPIREPSPTGASSSSIWTNPTSNPGWTNQNMPGIFSSNVQWPQNYQYQQIAHNAAYPQTGYGQQPHQFSDYGSQPVPNYGFNFPFQENVGTSFQSMSLPPPYHSNSNPEVYLNNLQHPVRIRRPVTDRFTNWNQRQYQVPKVQYYR